MSMYESQGQPQSGGWQGQSYPEQSQATTVLVLGIVGLVLCQICSPIAWIMGNKEVAAIDAGRRSPENRQQATIGRILGIIGTVLIVLAIVGILFSFVILGLTAASSNT